MTRPKNILEKEKKIGEKCNVIEKILPKELAPFFIYLQNSVSPKTRLAYLSDVRLFFEYLYNTSKPTIEQVKQVTHNDVSIYISQIDVSSATKSRKQCSLKALYSTLYKKDIVTNDITGKFDKIKVNKKSNEDIIALTEEGIQMAYRDVLKRKYSERNMLILKLFLTYGLRLDELVQLNIDSINTEKNEIKVYRKRGKIAKFPITDEIKQLLDQYLTSERKQLVRKSERALFISRQGNRLSPKAVENMVYEFCDVSPHKLRATCASQLIEQGFDIYDVMEYMDHDSPETTMLYARTKKNNKEKILKDFKI